MMLCLRHSCKVSEDFLASSGKEEFIFTSKANENSCSIALTSSGIEILRDKVTRSFA